LLIQLKREGKGNSLEYKIIQDHMQDLGKRRFPEIARRMVEDVRTLDGLAERYPDLPVTAVVGEMLDGGMAEYCLVAADQRGRGSFGAQLGPAADPPAARPGRPGRSG
jgi:hypothetical protein